MTVKYNNLIKILIIHINKKGINKVKGGIKVFKRFELSKRNDK